MDDRACDTLSEMHTRTLLSSELWVPLASVIAGLGAFGFIAISSRSLGLDDYVPIGQLWSIWALAFAVVSFTSQQTVVRGHVIRREVSVCCGPTEGRLKVHHLSSVVLRFLVQNGNTNL